MSANILLVDDSKTVCNTLKDIIKKQLNYNVIIFNSKQECSDFLINNKSKIDVALLDLGLPDAPNGEVVDLVTKYEIPSIVLTGSIDKEDIFRSKNIVDYVIKDASYSYYYAVSLVKRIIKNSKLKVIVASSDIKLANEIRKLLKRYNVESFFATNSHKVLEILEGNKVEMVFIDENIDNNNSLELLKNIRKNYSKNILNITKICEFGDRKAVSSYLKHGSNELLFKGFTSEEFYARLNADLEILELFKDISNKANKDYLTGLYNRRYFFDEGKKLYDNNDNVKLFMIDIDNFKNINDKYGHDAGDLAIKEVVKILDKTLKNVDFLISRFGGEEFCGLILDCNEDKFLKTLENIRKNFENNILKTKKEEIKFTVSIGYALNKLSNLDEMINSADIGLYKAKKYGRNQVRS